ncbi:hypothetical protein [Modicisalibacter coralii]|uniref:hypothetical protein n=1 Tax=Modicisalibacter coralii TaxID=2304602 RepID=UPI00100B5318|nr:hypothetical protein [Halomonas coralii]
MNVTQAKNSSRSFHLACQRTLEQRQTSHGQVEILMVPGVVCAAFSIELGIKAIALGEGTQPTGHKLDKLFGTLSAPEQDAIKESIGLPNTDFQKELEAAAGAFEEWRYIYEGTETVSANLQFLQRFSSAVQSRL